MPLIGMSSKTERNESRKDKNNLFIMREQLVYNGFDLIKRIPSLCIACKENDSYKVWIQEISGQGGLGSFGVETVYWCRCMHCSDGFEIILEDYSKIRPILKLNLKLQQGKISDDVHQNKIEKIKEKLYRKLSST